MKSPPSSPWPTTVFWTWSGPLSPSPPPSCASWPRHSWAGSAPPPTPSSSASATRGCLKNEAAVVTSLVDRATVQQADGQEVLQRSFHGLCPVSWPPFSAAVSATRRLLKLSKCWRNTGSPIDTLSHPPRKEALYGHVPFHPSDHVRHRRPGGRHCDAPAPGPEAAPRWITCALWGVVFLRMICPVGCLLPVSLVPQAITSGPMSSTSFCRARAGPGNGPRPRHACPGREHTLSAGDGTPLAPAAPADIPRPALLTGGGRVGRGRPALGRSLLRQTPPAGGGGRAGGERGL